MNILIKSAKIIDSNSPLHNKKMDILIEKGIITEIKSIIKNAKKYKEISFDNLHVSNGWFDASVCLGEPGYEERETIENGLITAAKSGFTGIAVNPNTNPTVDNKSLVEFLINKSKGKLTSLFPIGCLSTQGKGENLAELFDMQTSGAIGFGDYASSISNANLLKIALLYSRNFDGLIMSFPSDKNIVGDGLANENINSTKLGLKGIPNLAEELQIARDLFILEYTGGRLHIPTISTAKSVKLIREAKNKGLNVSCSVTAHHLYLTDDELKKFDGNYKITPPLRTNKEKNALIKGVQNGTIDMIVSDHNPIDIELKKVEFQNAKCGTIGLETLFGVINNIFDLDTTIASITYKPRAVFNIKNQNISINQQANLTLFNPDTEYTFEEKHILSTSKNSAFLGKKMKGKVYGTIANNKSEIN